MQTGVEKIVDFDLAEVFTEDFDSRRNPAQSIAIRPSDVLSSHNIALPSENAALSDCFDLSSLNIETLGSCAFSARDIALRDCVDLPSRDIVLSNSVDSAQQDDIAPESVDFSPCKGSTLVYISSDDDSPDETLVSRLLEQNLPCADEVPSNVWDSSAACKNISVDEGGNTRSLVKKKTAMKKKKTSPTCKGPYIPPVSSDFSASQRKALLAYIRVLRHRSRNTRGDFSANLTMRPTHCVCNAKSPFLFYRRQAYVVCDIKRYKRNGSGTFVGQPSQMP